MKGTFVVGMNKTAFEKLKTRLRAGDRDVFIEILGECSEYCTQTLMKRAGCDRMVAEEILVDAMLVFVDKVLNEKVVSIHNLKEYIFLSCWELWRSKHKRDADPAGKKDLIKQAFYELSQQKYDRDIQEQILKSTDDHFSNLLFATDQALSRLDPEGQRILSLFYHHKCSLDEISQLVGLRNTEEAKTLKSFYYTQWMKEIESQMVTS